ncbi:MAG: glycosyltransferase family 39 protein [Thermodesulfobacteriota bacterium]|nr:glycosyltransferase family 39 protein [Thermodesulfobacteriota bacterium]
MIIASCLFLLGIITRIPFASNLLYLGDSARFALAMKEYDVAQMRPHAPGYILYVALVKLVDFFINNEPASLVVVSIASSALTVFFLYFLAVRMYERSTAIISASLLLTSPLFWFNAEIPLTYALEGLLSVTFAYTCYKIIAAEKQWLLSSAIILGLATGIRQNIVIMFLPLWLYAIRKSSFKQIFFSFLLFGVTCLAWFTPMIALTGGLQKYFAAVDAQFNTWVLHPAPFLFQIKGRWGVFSTFMVYSLGLGLLPMIYYFGRLFKIPTIMEDVRLKLLLLWLLPAVLFFIAVNVFNPGHVVVILPPIFLCLAESVKGLAGDLAQGIKTVFVESSSNLCKLLRGAFSYKAILTSSVILLMLINIYTFLFRNTQVSYAAIKDGDAKLAELVRLTKENFISEKTMILTCWFNTQAGFYLPHYLIYCPFPLIFSTSEVPIEAQNVYITFGHQTNPKTYWIPTGFRIQPLTVPTGIDTVILWEKEIAQYYNDSPQPLKEIHSNLNDTKIYFLKVEPEQKIYYHYHYFTLR